MEQEKISSNPTQEQENKPPQFKYIHSDVNVPTQFWPSNDWIKKTMLWFSCTRSFFGTVNNSNFSYAKAMILIDKQEFPNINEIGCFEETEQILLYFSNQTKQFSKSDLAWIFYCLIFTDRYVNEDVSQILVNLLSKLNNHLVSLKSIEDVLYPYLCLDSLIISSFFHQP